jgi:uncharacterized circularly permuted ATP-grasp superfamily protein/uncharacterized alpha-E superfamily protein
MTTTDAPGLVASYRPLPGAFDEMVDGDGRLRDQWAHVGAALEGLGLAEMRRRQAEADRLLDDDGVTYNVYGSPTTRWALDPVPVLMTSDEWAGIESGVIQRAELLNLVLADLYGPRDLIHRKLLPPELIFGHAGFLRQCDQIRLPGPLQLFNLAVDLSRDSDGRCWVLADRTQAPSGAGYALENRTVVSRVFPSLYRDGQVHRLAPFFRALRAGLQAVASRGPSSDPRIVVLTPGAHSETAFEHALLAAHLGYPLVEATDLTVQEGRVWMRSLGRLDPVDVILRRVDAWFCDPLELRPDSYLGVPGLVEACRQGSVSVVNTLGSGVLENPGLFPFFPRLAERLLGESLQLPLVPTWWCGEPAGRSHVVAHLDELVIKPIDRTDGSSVIFGWQLSSAELDDLRRRIDAHPYAWVGQSQLSLGSAPTLSSNGLEPRRSVLRTFAVARGDSYMAMAGGLTRVAERDALVISNQMGAVSKDTWVLASEPEQMAGYWLSTGPAVAAVEPAASVSSRAAENLVWLGRYAERAESVVRLLRVVHDRRNDFADGTNPAGTACVHALLAALTNVTDTQPGFVGPGPDVGRRLASPGDELQSLAVDGDRPGTLAFDVQKLLDAAYGARDHLSVDTWLVVSSLHRDLLDIPSLGRVTLRRVLASLLALAGLGAESMVRDPGWRFMDAGRRIERGAQIAALLRSTVTIQRGEATDSLLLESVLMASESIITYRRRYRSHAQLETLLDLLVADADNPRSLIYQVDCLLEDLRALPGHPGGGRVSEAEKPVLEASTALRVADTAQLAAVDGVGGRPALDAFLLQTIDRLYAAFDQLAAAHFTQLPPQRAVLTPADPRAARANHLFEP